MNILMVTNTFTPHVGGVARSVQQFSDEYEKLGHRVGIIAPGVEGNFRKQSNVVRIPALGDVNGSSFALPLVNDAVKRILKLGMAWLKPDVVHTHHPFLLGSIARQLSSTFKVPLVFTHHTMYEQFSYVLGDVGRSDFTKNAIVNVSTTFANTCDRVFAPSESTKQILRERGVHTAVDVVPTGVDVENFGSGDRQAWRKKLDIPSDAPVFGFISRMAPEKNLAFLLDSAKRILLRYPEAHCLLVGDGPSGPDVRQWAQATPRAHMLGSRSGRELVDAFATLDVFAFASLSETQGMVLVEAMAAGVPVVALDAPGSRDVVRRERNGCLVPRSSTEAAAFEDAVERALRYRGSILQQGARSTASQFSQRACALRALDAYRRTTFEDKDTLRLRSLMRLFR